MKYIAYGIAAFHIGNFPTEVYQKNIHINVFHPSTVE